MYNNLKSKFYQYYEAKPSLTTIPEIHNKNLLCEVLEEFKPEKRKRKKGHYFDNQENFGLKGVDEIALANNSKEFDFAFDRIFLNLGLLI